MLIVNSVASGAVSSEWVQAFHFNSRKYFLTPDILESGGGWLVTVLCVVFMPSILLLALYLLHVLVNKLCYANTQ